MSDIRSATTSDLDGLVDLESALFAEDAGVHDPFADVTWPSREGRADFESLIDSEQALVLVTVRSGRPAGFLVGYTAESSPTRRPATYAVLRSLYVVADSRGQGVARRLVAAFLAWAAEQGCAEAHVDHYAANERAGRLYDGLGFTARSVSRACPIPHS